MERRLFTSESVTEGHPDKICDQISDAVLDALMEQDPMSRVACETSITTGLVLVMGEITTNAYVDIQKIVRDTVREIGYTRGKYGFDADTCGVITAIDEQSADIAMGVDKALEAKEHKMSDEEIDAKLQDILDFADIGEFIHQPVKTYSSGMFVRLAFAVAINIDPEILIVDEALSVGDVFFQAKCYHKFEEFKKMGKTILFVSHDLGSIGKYCDRVVLLNKGVKLAEGKPKDMIDLYKRVMAESKMEDSPKKEDGHAAIEGVAWKESMILNPDKQEYGDKKAEIIDFGIFDATGN